MRVFRFLAAICTMLILCGCSKQAEPPSATTDFPEPEEVILWIPEGHTDLVTELCKDFTDLHPEKRYALILNEITEQEITAAAMKSESAPDVLFLPSGSLPSLAAAGVLSKADINAINSDKSALDSAMFAGRLLAYPCAAECCILFYDRSVFNEEEAESLYAIMQKDTEKQANLAADLNSADVLCSFFLGAGCTLDKPESFGSDNGLLVLQLISELADRENFIAECDDHDIKTGFAKRRIAAAVSTPLNAKAISSSLGSDFGVAKLPTTVLPDGRTIQPAAIADFMLVAVRENSEASATAHELAQFLTNSSSQLLRLQRTGLIPTDTTLAYNDDVRAQFPAVAAVYDQLSYSTSINSASGRQSLFTACNTLGNRLITDNYDSLQACLDEYCAQLRQ